MSTLTTRPTELTEPLPEPAISWQASLLVIIGTMLGANLALWLLPSWLPTLISDITSQQAAWHLARSSGVAAYLLIWLSTALGLSITNRMARVWPGGPTAFDLHQFTGLLSLAAAVFHALILLGDDYIGYTLSQIAVPFAAVGYRPLSTGWGQLALYLAAVVSFSFYVKGRIGRKAWRLIHFASFLVFGLVTLHGLLAGTDTGLLWPMYAGAAVGVLFLTFYRIFVTAKP
ncbi:MAG: hypothetical protein D6775_05910 [Caldilineae bacterium]|nr:MAG: hypothetical protein D6775_05910 [Caldilineae bacterium]